MRLKVTLSLLLVLSLLILGCGSSGTTGGGTGGDTTGSSSGGETTGGETTSGETTGGETTSGETTGGETAGGDTTGGEATSSAPLTKAAFIKKGEFICELVPTSYNEKLEALKKESKAQKKKTSKSEENLKAAVPPLRTAIEEFEALTPPKGSEKEVEAIIAALGAAADGIEEKPTSELSGPKSPFAEFQKLTGKFGLNRCTTL